MRLLTGPIFKKSKELEFIGDKLLDVILTDIYINNGGDYRKANRSIQKFTTNKYLSKVAKRLQMAPQKTSINDNKCYANAYEHKVGLLYKEHGMDAAFDFVFETIGCKLK